VNEKSAAAAARATVYGYPRQGPDRELKKAIEGYWKGRVTADALQETTAQLRRNAWRELAEAGIHEVPRDAAGSAAGDDQVVRHELPLPGAGTGP
jgi:5-methyltetrahydropteroyltriglutamate--homocysteine methyltransferase